MVVCFFKGPVPTAESASVWGLGFRALGSDLGFSEDRVCLKGTCRKDHGT